jgi:hypothetical protein
MRVVAAATLCAILLTGGCTTPDGQFDAGPAFALAAPSSASARTTKLYDRRGEAISLDEVERISL